MSFVPPSPPELDHLTNTVNKHAPELLPVVDYLMSSVRTLSEMSINAMLAHPEDTFTLQDYRRLVVLGTMPEDLRELARSRFASVSDDAQRRRLWQLMHIIEKILEIEARAKIERLWTSES